MKAGMGKGPLLSLKTRLLELLGCLGRKEPEARPVVQAKSIEFAVPEDEIEIRFPVEFFVEGIPVSLQASGASRAAWGGQVNSAAAARLSPASWATESPVKATIFYFPDGRMLGDIDNIVKPILDALKQLIYVDDSQIDRVIVQKFESDRSFRIENPSPMLAAALETEPPVVYIRIDDEVSSNME